MNSRTFRQSFQVPPGSRDLLRAPFMEAFIAIAAVIGLVWGTVFVLRGSLMAGCLAFVLVNSCFGFYFYSTRIGPVEVTLDRVVLIVLVVAYAVHRALGRTEPKPLGVGDAALLALLAWLTFRTFTEDWWHAPRGFVVPVWHLIVGYLSPLAIYWIVRQSPLTEHSVRWMQRFLIGLGIYLAATAAAEVAQQWWAVFPRHIADPEVGLHFGRARGPMVQSIVLGFFLSVSAACAWIYAGQFGRRGRVLLVGLVGLFLGGAFLTYTRCVWMGAAAAVAIAMVFTLPRRVSVVLMGGCASVFLLLAVSQWDRLMSIDAGRSAAESRDSTYMRAAFAYVSWEMFLDHPLVGVGFGQYLDEKNPYLSDRSTELRLEGIRDQLLHNLFLSILVETGLIGLLLFLSVLGVWVYQGWRLWRDERLPPWARSHGLLMLAAVGAYVPNALFQPVGHMNTVHMLLFFLAGTLSGLTAQFRPGVVAAASQLNRHFVAPRRQHA